MVSFECPWCGDATHLPYPLPEDPEAAFTCVACGTTIEWAEEPVALDLAA